MAEHVKPRLLGHFGAVQNLNTSSAHLNRAIVERDLNAIFVNGPGHGSPANVANAYLEGTYSELFPSVRVGRGEPARALPPVLLPGRDPEPRRPGDAGLDSRGRRARLRARPRVRRGLRQPRPARRLRRRRRRGRDGPARRQLALEQVPQPAPRRGRAPDPAPERLQDREPGGARPDPGERAAGALRGLRLGAGARLRRLRRRGSGGGARALRGRARGRARHDRLDPARGARGGRAGAAALADADPAHAEGVDRATRGRRRPGRGDLALAPGAARGRPGQSRAAAPLEAWLPATGRRSSSTTRAGSCPSSPRCRRTASAG